MINNFQKHLLTCSQSVNAKDTFKNTLEKWAQEGSPDENRNEAKKRILAAHKSKGDLDLHNFDKLTSLPNDLHVEGGLYLSDCTSLTEFPNGLKITTILNISGTSLLADENPTEKIKSIFEKTGVIAIEARNTLAFKPSNLGRKLYIDFGRHLKTLEETIETANTERIDFGTGRLQERRMEILCDQVLNALREKCFLSDERFQLVPQLSHQYNLLGKTDGKIQELRQRYGAALTEIPGVSDLMGSLGYEKADYAQFVKDHHLFFKWNPLDGDPYHPKQIISVSDAYYTHLVNPEKYASLTPHQKTLPNNVLIYQKNQPPRLAHSIEDIKDIPLLYRANLSPWNNKLFKKYFGLFGFSQKHIDLLAKSLNQSISKEKLVGFEDQKALSNALESVLIFGETRSIADLGDEHVRKIDELFLKGMNEPDDAASTSKSPHELGAFLFNLARMWIHMSSATMFGTDMNSPEGMRHYAAALLKRAYKLNPALATIEKRIEQGLTPRLVGGLTKKGKETFTCTNILTTAIKDEINKSTDDASFLKATGKYKKALILVKTYYDECYPEMWK